jgi:heme/copper-type cytochrome/quinol oxidase subunit 3
VSLHADIDVRGLPAFVFGSRGIMWWGIVGFLAIETTMLAICVLSYFYFRSAAEIWPPPPVAPPGLDAGTVTLALLLLSILPMTYTERAANRLDLRATILGHVACDVVGIAIVVSRTLEFYRMNVLWDANAYGSVLWAILVLHTFHLFAEVVETIVITIMFLVGDTEPKYVVDATDNGLYWYFIVTIWVPCYVTIYLVPRLS